MKFSAHTSEVLGFTDRDLNTISNTELNGAEKDFDANKRTNNLIALASGAAASLGATAAVGGLVATAPVAAIASSIVIAGIGIAAVARSYGAAKKLEGAGRELGQEMDRRDGISEFTALNRETLGTDDANINQASRLDLLRQERNTGNDVRRSFMLAGAGGLTSGAGIAAIATGVLTGAVPMILSGIGVMSAGGAMAKTGLDAGNQLKDEKDLIHTEIQRRSMAPSAGPA